MINTEHWKDDSVFNQVVAIYGQLLGDLIKRCQAKKEESDYPDYIQMVYSDCLESGELISESDGQFTGGYIVLVYRYAGDVYEFGYQNEKFVDMTVFDGELY